MTDETIEKHFAMTGSYPSGFCVYENHKLCNGTEENNGRECTCVCHKPDINEIVGDWLEDFEQRVEKSVRDLIRAQGESVTVADSYLKAMERINKENVAIRDAFLALQDVLGLHEETCGEMGLGDAHRGMCVQDEQDYPCDTRQAITNRIGKETIN